MKTILFVVIVLGTALQFCEAETSKMACTVPNCPTGCKLDENHQPCPECVCDDYHATRIRRAFPSGSSLSMPSCNRPDCHFTTNSPLPDCLLLLSLLHSKIKCTKPKCDEPGCSINYYTLPCPSCQCSNDRSKREVACSMPKCDEPGCSIDYSTLPCPSCQCSNDRSEKQVACSMPKCDEPGCSMDYSTVPCPSCRCSNEENVRRRRSAQSMECSKPRCKRGCFVDYTAYPCPRCQCNYDRVKQYTVSCSTPICEAGCIIDFSTKPCPSCKCNDKPHVNPARV